MARTFLQAEMGQAVLSQLYSSLPDEALAVARTSNSYRELFDGREDRIVEYRTIRRGFQIVSHINFTLLRRIRSSREDRSVLRR